MKPAPSIICLIIDEKVTIGLLHGEDINLPKEYKEVFINLTPPPLTKGGDTGG